MNQIIKLSYVILLIFCSLSHGQKISNQPNCASLQKWNSLNLNNISPDGKWVSYTLSNDEVGDILVLQNENNDVRFNFANPNFSKFEESHWFSVKTEEQISFINLKNAKKTSYSDLISFEFINSDKYLILLQQDYLQILNADNQKIFVKLPNVVQYRLNPSKDRLLYTQKIDSIIRVGIIELSTMKNSVLTNLENECLEMVWNNTGEAVAFFEKTSQHDYQLFYFDLVNNQNYKLDLPSEFSLNPKGKYQLLISEDLEKVFFQIQDKDLQTENWENDRPQIWLGDTQLTYPQEKAFCDSHKKGRLAVWFPKFNKFIPITKDICDKVMLSKNKNFAIVFNPKKYEPHFDYYSPVDYEIIDLKSNIAETFLTYHPSNTNYIIPSLTEKYVAYFDNQNWFVYDVQTKKHKNLTSLIKTNWKSDINDFNGEIIPFGVAGWANDDKYLLLYDKWDIWQFNIKEDKATRITNGNKSNIQYRLITPFEGRDPSYDGNVGKDLLATNRLLIKATGSDGNSGYFKWSEKSGLKEIIYKSAKIDQLLHQGDTFIYREQRFDTPPRVIKTTKAGKTKTLFQSNPHYLNKEKRKVEIINYESSSGLGLKGVLYYPENFKPNKKYPMVVNIYETMFDEYHNYHIPSKADPVGFNIPNFTSDGYFILLPDIYYELGNVGKSATDCVVAAVLKAKENESIGKVGLIGHSFGGYETNFIITQTDIFDAAVSSAGVSDVVSFYLNLNGNNGKPDHWRFEHHQWRMGKSFFDHKDLYYRNSPISFAANIKTPLLHWTGKEDFHVNWQQSITWYLALRRLGKEQKLLLYPEEGHILLNANNKYDITKRVKQWFNLHLKN